MLGIKRETDYAVRTVLHLASIGGGETVQVRDVAEQKALPLSFVRRIVARLSASGIVATTRGMGGGVQLGRPASEISLLDVCRAMGDDIALNRCLDGVHTCPFAEGCAAQLAWADATALLEEHLASVTFDALARRDRKHGLAHQRLSAVATGTPGPVRRESTEGADGG